MAEAPDPGERGSNRAPPLTPVSQLALFELVQHREGDEFVVGRIETGDFVTLPHVGKLAIDLIQQTRSLEDVADSLSNQYQIDFDVEAFAGSLVELGFVKAIDGVPIAGVETTNVAFPRLQARHVSWLFSLPVKALYALVVAGAMGAVIIHPGILPGYAAFFWTARETLATLVNVGMAWASLAVHEVFHLFAARSLNLPARMSLGTRLTNLVVQTDVSSAWSLPRQQRYRIYLAGMAWDLFLVSICLLAIAYAGFPPMLNDLLSALILLALLGVLWQFQIFMRTDMYYVVSNWLHAYNLFDDSRAYVTFLANRAFVRLGLGPKAAHPNPVADHPKREQQQIKAYTILLVLGSALSLSAFVCFGAPILVGLFLRAVESIRVGLASGAQILVVDGVIVITLQTATLVAFLVTFVKNHPEWFSRQLKK